MPPLEEKTKKPKLSEELLKNEGIFFFDKVHHSKELPESFWSIPEHLLHFRGRLPGYKREDFRKERKIFRKAWHDHDEASEGNWDLMPPKPEPVLNYIDLSRHGKAEPTKRMETELMACMKIRRESIELREKNVMEPPWVVLLRRNIFRTFEEVHKEASTYDKIHMRWELHHDLQWDETMMRETTKRTGPKPDLTFAFPIIDTAKMPTLLSCSDQQVESLSLRVLKELRMHPQVELRSAPTTQLRQYNEKKPHTLRDAHLICFPWAVVEVKKLGDGNSSKTTCYCQAANASAAALALRERLAQKISDCAQSRDALVIFAFTFIGPSVKLWITYRDVDSKRIEMRCIWASSVELTWGAIVLRMVVKNMRDWVYSRVKGEIARWINVLRQNLRSPTLVTPDGDLIRQRARAASCAPSYERPTDTPPTTPDRRLRLPATPNGLPRSAPRPNPPRGKTAPESAGGQKYRYPSRRNSLEGNFVVPDSDGDYYERRAGCDSDYVYRSQSDDEGDSSKSEVESTADDENGDDDDIKDHLRPAQGRYERHYSVSETSGPQSTDGEDETEEYSIDEPRFMIRTPKVKVRKSFVADSRTRESQSELRVQGSKERRRSLRI